MISLCSICHYSTWVNPALNCEHPQKETLKPVGFIPAVRFCSAFMRATGAEG